ncbi:glycosyltransferase family A protein [Providencia sp. PROV114]|uniref:glycosyltransferase family A protein n=1 Tax=Providencia sp. PROV114 TaxID=2949825 RepID=UPI00234AAB28|nr:glycosyltransferase family A protein [Providencia sp. PROV114]WOB82039.1 glycosyltransferase family A protein [Providencia sp. PROV114]
MKFNAASIPIVIMTRNESGFISKCVSSIINTVTIDFHIYIVDNNSTDYRHLDELDKIKSNYPNLITLVSNKKNKWVIGINETLKEIKKNHRTKYFILTDGDIDFSKCITPSSCWLTYLINRMDENISIGKIGLSLSWEYMLENEVFFKNVINQEEGLYNNSKMINDLYISSVDTTAAIYRWDWSIEKSSKFYPDHMRYLRPELYSCRTNRTILVEHMGWRQYNTASNNVSELNSKILCFTLYGGHVKTEILNKADKKYKLTYTLLSYPIHKVWVIRRWLFSLIYFVRKIRVGFDGQNSSDINNQL